MAPGIRQSVLQGNGNSSYRPNSGRASTSVGAATVKRANSSASYGGGAGTP